MDILAKLKARQQQNLDENKFIDTLIALVEKGYQSDEVKISERVAKQLAPLRDTLAKKEAEIAELTKPEKLNAEVI